MVTSTLERLVRSVDMADFDKTPKGAAFDIVERSFANSFCISADGAHACHPNYPEKHEKNHKPTMGKGPVIKYNSNQRYATNAVTSSLIREIAKKQGIPLQIVMVANDSGCGTTIGPIFSEKTGIRTMDVGVAQLAMHSIREMCGASDIDRFSQLLSAFYTHFKSVDSKLSVDA